MMESRQLDKFISIATHVCAQFELVEKLEEQMFLPMEWGEELDANAEAQSHRSAEQARATASKLRPHAIHGRWTLELPETVQTLIWRVCNDATYRERKEFKKRLKELLAERDKLKARVDPSPVPIDRYEVGKLTFEHRKRKPPTGWEPLCSLLESEFGQPIARTTAADYMTHYCDSTGQEVPKGQPGRRSGRQNDSD